MRKDYLHIGFLIFAYWVFLYWLDSMLQSETIWYWSLQILGIVVILLGLLPDKHQLNK